MLGIPNGYILPDIALTPYRVIVWIGRIGIYLFGFAWICHAGVSRCRRRPPTSSIIASSIATVTTVAAAISSSRRVTSDTLCPSRIIIWIGLTISMGNCSTQFWWDGLNYIVSLIFTPVRVGVVIVVVDIGTTAAAAHAHAGVEEGIIIIIIVVEGGIVA